MSNFIYTILDNVYTLLFNVKFTELQFDIPFYKYIVALFSFYLIVRLITMFIGFIVKFIRGVIS